MPTTYIDSDGIFAFVGFVSSLGSSAKAELPSRSTQDNSNDDGDDKQRCHDADDDVHRAKGDVNLVIQAAAAAVGSGELLVPRLLQQLFLKGSL